jgi:hypothetical protein
MLDVKLANYWPFLELMDSAGGGMFVTASDDIESFDVSESDFGAAKRHFEIQGHDSPICKNYS